MLTFRKTFFEKIIASHHEAALLTIKKLQQDLKTLHGLDTLIEMKQRDIFENIAEQQALNPVFNKEPIWSIVSKFQAGLLNDKSNGIEHDLQCANTFFNILEASKL